MFSSKIPSASWFELSPKKPVLQNEALKNSAEGRFGHLKSVFFLCEECVCVCVVSVCACYF